MNNRHICFVYILILLNISWVSCFYIGRYDVAKTLAKIKEAYQELDPRDFIDLPDGQKDDCLIWAFGKEWESIKWSYRDQVFRDRHPELNPEDFAGHTEVHLFWKRITRAYLDRNEI